MEPSELIRKLNNLISKDTIVGADYIFFIKSLSALTKPLQDENQFPIYSPVAKQWIYSFKEIFEKVNVDYNFQKIMDKSCNVMTETYLTLLDSFHQFGRNYCEELYSHWNEIASRLTASKRAKSFIIHFEQFKVTIHNLKTAPNRFVQLTILKVLILYIKKVKKTKFRKVIIDENNVEIIDQLIVLRKTPSEINFHNFLYNTNSKGIEILSFKPTRIFCHRLGLDFTTSEYEIWIDFNLKDESIAFFVISLTESADNCVGIISRPKLKAYVVDNKHVITVAGIWTLLINKKSLNKRIEITVMFPIQIRETILDLQVKHMYRFKVNSFVNCKSQSQDKNTKTSTAISKREESILPFVLSPIKQISSPAGISGNRIVTVYNSKYPVGQELQHQEPKIKCIDLNETDDLVAGDKANVSNDLIVIEPTNDIYRTQATKKSLTPIALQQLDDNPKEQSFFVNKAEKNTNVMHSQKSIMPIAPPQFDDDRRKKIDILQIEELPLLEKRFFVNKDEENVNVMFSEQLIGPIALEKMYENQCSEESFCGDNSFEKEYYEEDQFKGFKNNVSLCDDAYTIRHARETATDKFNSTKATQTNNLKMSFQSSSLQTAQEQLKLNSPNFKELKSQLQDSTRKKAALEVSSITQNSSASRTKTKNVLQTQELPLLEKRFFVNKAEKNTNAMPTEQLIEPIAQIDVNQCSEVRSCGDNSFEKEESEEDEFQDFENNVSFSDDIYVSHERERATDQNFEKLIQPRSVQVAQEQRRVKLNSPMQCYSRRKIDFKRNLVAMIPMKTSQKEIYKELKSQIGNSPRKKTDLEVSSITQNSSASQTKQNYVLQTQELSPLEKRFFVNKAEKNTNAMPSEQLIEPIPLEQIDENQCSEVRSCGDNSFEKEESEEDEFEDFENNVSLSDDIYVSHERERATDHNFEMLVQPGTVQVAQEQRRVKLNSPMQCYSRRKIDFKGNLVAMIPMQTSQKEINKELKSQIGNSPRKKADLEISSFTQDSSASQTKQNYVLQTQERPPLEKRFFVNKAEKNIDAMPSEQLIKPIPLEQIDENQCSEIRSCGDNSFEKEESEEDEFQDFEKNVSLSNDTYVSHEREEATDELNSTNVKKTLNLEMLCQAGSTQAAQEQRSEKFNSLIQCCPRRKTNHKGNLLPIPMQTSQDERFEKFKSQTQISSRKNSAREVSLITEHSTASRTKKTEVQQIQELREVSLPTINTSTQNSISAIDGPHAQIKNGDSNVMYIEPSELPTPDECNKKSVNDEQTVCPIDPIDAEFIGSHPVVRNADGTKLKAAGAAFHDDEKSVFTNDEQFAKAFRLYVDNDGLNYLNSKKFKRMKANAKQKVERELRSVHATLRNVAKPLDQDGNHQNEIDIYEYREETAQGKSKRVAKSKNFETNEFNVTISTQDEKTEHSQNLSVSITRRKIRNLSLLCSDTDAVDNRPLSKTNKQIKRKSGSEKSQGEQSLKKPRKVTFNLPQKNNAGNTSTTLNTTLPRKLPVYASQKMIAKFKLENSISSLKDESQSDARTTNVNNEISEPKVDDETKGESISVLSILDPNNDGQIEIENRHTNLFELSCQVPSCNTFLAEFSALMKDMQHAICDEHRKHSMQFNKAGKSSSLRLSFN